MSGTTGQFVYFSFFKAVSNHCTINNGSLKSMVWFVGIVTLLGAVLSDFSQLNQVIIFLWPHLNKPAHQTCLRFLRFVFPLIPTPSGERILS